MVEQGVATPDPGVEPRLQPPALVLPNRWRAAIIHHLSASVPLEGVGLLAVPDGADADEPVVRAIGFYPGTNGAASATRYTMPPEEVIAAFVDMRARGWRLGGIVHSHPRGPATPSPTDLREAYYPEALMVIVSFAVTPPEIRAWWVGAADGRPREVPVVGGGTDDVPMDEQRGG